MPDFPAALLPTEGRRFMTQLSIAYELCGGRRHELLRGTDDQCVDYVLANPAGPRGGSTHVRMLPPAKVGPVRQPLAAFVPPDFGVTADDLPY